MSNAGQAATAVVGGVIGFFVGGPTGALYGFQAGLLVGTALFPTQLPGIEGPRLEDFEAIHADPGAPVYVCWGTIAVPGFRMYMGEVEEVATTEEVGGKGPPEQEVTTYTYFQTIALGLCEGPIQGVKRIWENGELVYDRREQQEDETDDDYAQRLLASTLYEQTFILYLGTEDQLADPTIEAEMGAGNVPGYRGLSYIVWPERQLRRDQGHRHPQFKVEIVKSDVEPAALEPVFSSPDDLGGWQVDSIHVAWDYNYYVVFDDVGTQGMRVFRISDNTEIAQWEESSTYLFGMTRDNTALGRSAATIGRLDGLVYFSYFAGSNDCALVAVNAFTGELDHAAALGEFPGLPPQNGDRDFWEDVDNFVVGDEQFLIAASLLSGGRITLYRCTPFSAIVGSSFGLGKSVICTGYADGDVGYAFGITYKAATSGTGLDANLIQVSVDAESPEEGTISTVGAIAPSDVDADWTRFSAFKNLRFDQYDNTIIAVVDGGPSTSGTEQRLVKIDPSDASVVWSVETPVDFINAQDGGSSRVSGHVDVYTGGSGGDINVYFVDTRDGSITEADWSSAVPDIFVGAQQFDARTQTVVTMVQNEGPYVLKLAEPVGYTTIAEIIGDICERCGLESTQYDVSELTEEQVLGYALTRESTGRGGIDPLRATGLFDIVESGTKLAFRTRGRASSATLLDDDLGAYLEGSQRVPAVKTSKIQDFELPRRIRVQYISYARDYEPGEQLSPSRFTTGSVNETTVQVPIVLSDDRGAQIAEILYREAWASRWSHEIALDQSYAALEPADVILVPDENQLRRMRIVEINDTSLLLRKINAVRDDDGNYVSTAVATPPQKPTTTLELVASTEAILLDLPPLREEDDSAGLYVALKRDGTGTTWNGGALFKSTDGGTSWQQVLTGTSEATVGEVVTAPSGQTYTWNEESELVVDLETGSLQSRTDSAVLSGSNGAAIGADGRWQIVQFGRAELVSTGRYKLTRLLLGRRGTEHNVSTVEAGDKFVLLSGAGIYRLTLQSSEIDASRTYRAVSLGQSFSLGADQSFSGGGESLETFAGVYVSGARDASGNLTIDWFRRDRLSHTLRDGVDTPMNESTEEYEIDVLSEDSPATVLRTLESTDSTVTYSAADQEEDFGSPIPSSVTVRIYQMSATVGRGTPVEATI